jgi:PAS domain S-box-containing protein
MLKYQHKILFVDDELDNLKLLERIFRQSQTVFLAQTPQAAFEILDEHEISLIISDQRMPEMTGLELLAKVSERSPYSIRYLLTGIVEGDEIQTAISSDLIFGYILKPFKIAELKTAITRALEYYELRRETLRLRHDWQQAAREMAIFSEIGSAVVSGSAIGDILDRIVKAVCINFGYQSCAIELIDKNSWELFTEACYGYTEEVKKRRLAIEGEGLIAYVARTGKLAYLPDVTKDERYLKVASNTRSQLAIPLHLGEEIIGVLTIESVRFDDFSERDIFLLSSFADKAAGIVYQSQLFNLVSQGKAEWESTFDAMADAVFIFDSKQRLRRVNRAGAKMFNRDYDALLGAKCCDLFTDEERTGCLTERLFKQRQRIVENQLFGQEQTPIVITADPLLDEKKDLLGCVLTVRDQSELDRAEAEARSHREFLAGLVENAFDSILVLDLNGKITWANSRTFEMLGDGMTLKSSTFEEFVMDESKEKTRAVFSRVLNGKPQIFESSIKLPSGDIRNFTITGSPVTISGNINGILIIARDITEQKRNAERAAEIEKLRTLGQLASGVAHDFNNILAAILGRTQLMQRKLEDPELIRNLQVIERASRDGARMAQRIRDFARPNNSKDSYGIVELGELILDAIDVTAPRWREEAHRSGRRIEVEFYSDAEVNVHGDAAELREVLTNLILNSVDAMPHGGKIKIECGNANGNAFIHVIDDGIGIPEELQNHIFEPFFTTKGERGTGLGLNVSQSIIVNHGGDIEVDSKPGYGTTMRVLLPVFEDSDLLSTTIHTTEMQIPPISKILVVDDEEDVRDLLADILSSFGHEVVTAKSGERAIELLEETDFQLLVTDLGMPDMSGGELAERAKQIRSGIPVILCTGWGESINSIYIKDGVIDLIITKPFDLEQVANALTQTLCFQQ